MVRLTRYFLNYVQNNFLLAVIICPFFLFSQNISSELSDHIELKIKSIDSLIDNRIYDLALDKIQDLESYNRYISVYENRLELDLKKAKVLFGIGEEDKAMDLLLEGLVQLDSLNQQTIESKYLNYIAKIFWRSRNYERSQYYFDRLLSNATRDYDTVNILESYLYKGLIASRNNKNDSAIYFYKKIIEYPVTYKTENLISKSYNNLSANESENGELDIAVEYANKAIEIKLQLKDSLGLAYALSNLSSVYYYRGEYKKAFDNYLYTNSLLSKLKHNENSHKLREDVLYNIAYASEMLNDFEKAYKYLEKASNLTDSLSNINRVQNISEIEAKYNLAKEAQKTEEERSKRLEAESKKLRAQSLFYGTALAFLALLALAYIFYRNYRLKQQAKLDQVENESQTKIINATIDAKEKERKAIAETLHDSVSALLSSANLHLQATKAQLKQKSPQEITKAQTIVNEASVKIRDLSHELISSVLLKFGLAFAVHDMCQKYSNSELTLHSDDDGIKRYHQDFEIKIHNIIEELINNILKHSKASNATVMLAHKENDMLSVRISDDGVGFNPRQARGKDGLGLSHIEARIKVMKGVFNIISSKDNGTNIFILVPIQFKESTVSA